jgi:predicted dinucleotide-binding enzyme
MFICGDDATAKTTVAGLSRDIGFDVVDAGPLRAAPLLKNLARSGAGREIAWKLMRR